MTDLGTFSKARNAQQPVTEGKCATEEVCGEAAVHVTNQLQPVECCRTGSQANMSPVIWDWLVSQGYHLKGGQRPPGRSHIFFLSQQPQQDIFFIPGPAVNVSVLKPGRHMFLQERE